MGGICKDPQQAQKRRPTPIPDLRREQSSVRDLIPDFRSSCLLSVPDLWGFRL